MRGGVSGMHRAVEPGGEHTPQLTDNYPLPFVKGRLHTRLVYLKSPDNRRDDDKNEQRLYRCLKDAGNSPMKSNVRS
jgi:hypothetical protein